MQTRIRFLWTLGLGVVMPPAMATAESSEITQVRQTSHAFISGIQRQDFPSEMFRWFANGAFTNPATRQITAFTGGDFNATPARIRQYVAETLARIATSTQNSRTRCFAPAAIKDELASGIQPDNDPVLDGFMLKRVTRELLNAVETEAAPTEPQVVLLRNQIQQRRSLVVMAVACNDVPLVIVWGRAKSGKWLIEALAVLLP
jgi:hypothetical protein